MTLSDAPAYRQLVRRVAAGRGKPASDEQLDGLWMLVSDLSYADFERALVAAARETRFFPSAADIHAYHHRAQAEGAVRPEILAAVSQGEVHCTQCQDTGWAPTTINATTVYGPTVTEVWGGTPEAPYVRGRFDPRAVPAVRVCGCRASNPVYQAMRVSARRLGTREPGSGA